MKISNIAISNVKGNLYRYIMYILSNAFAVTVFFIFANFVFHPNISTDDISGHTSLKEGVTNGMIACQVVIIVFTILFVSYSTSIFLKSRGKEFGLLSLYGITKKQIRKYVLIENTFLSLLSIVIGIFAGVIFSKLFFLVMEVFLSIKIPFHISFMAFGLTAVTFFTLFEIISLMNIIRIKNKEIIQQIQTNKVPKVIPKYSKIKSLTGVLLIIIGYGVAWFVPAMLVPIAMLPVILVVVIGTYFIFTQLGIAVANKIIKTEKILYKKSNLVAYSQMIFKLQDTAKVLFLAAILGAFTFTATETLYSFFQEIPSLAGLNTTQDMVIVQRGENMSDDIDLILDHSKVEIKKRMKINALLLYANRSEKSGGREYYVMSNSDYNALAMDYDKKLLDINKGEVVYWYPHDVGAGWKSIDLNVAGEIKNFSLSNEIYGDLLSLHKVRYYETLILNDHDFEKASAKVPTEDKVIYTGLVIEDWKKSYSVSMEIQNKLGEDYQPGEYYSKSILYKQERNNFGIVLFIGFFIAFLFFIASGSIIYFKLFNEIKQDGIEYDILRKIGATQKEINKIATKQIGIIFFLPFVVSTSHAFFALKSLSNLFGSNLFANGVIVMLGYFVFQFLYFIIIRAIYMKKISYI